MRGELACQRERSGLESDSISSILLLIIILPHMWERVFPFLFLDLRFSLTLQGGGGRTDMIIFISQMKTLRFRFQ